MVVCINIRFISHTTLEPREVTFTTKEMNLWLRKTTRKTLTNRQPSRRALLPALDLAAPTQTRPSPAVLKAVRALVQKAINLQIANNLE